METFFKKRHTGQTNATGVTMHNASSEAADMRKNCFGKRTVEKKRNQLIFWSSCQPLVGSLAKETHVGPSKSYYVVTHSVIIRPLELCNDLPPLR